MKKKQNEGMASTSNNEAQNTEMLNKMAEIARSYAFNYAEANYDYNPDMNDVAKYNGWLYDELMDRLYCEDSESVEDWLYNRFSEETIAIYAEDVCENFLDGDWYIEMYDAFSDGIEDYLGKQTKIEVVKIKTTSLGSDAIKGVWDDDKYVPTLANCTVMLLYADGTDKKITIENFPVLDGSMKMVKQVVRHLIPSLTYNAKEHKAFQQKVQEYVDSHLTVVEHKGYRYYDIVA